MSCTVMLHVSIAALHAAIKQLLVHMFALRFRPTLQLSQVIDGHILQLVKPAVTALNLCRAAWQQTPDHNLDISFG